MGSIAAMENGSKDRYFQADAKKLVRKALKAVWLTKVSWKIRYSS